jgi:hypothetical protein
LFTENPDVIFGCSFILFILSFKSAPILLYFQAMVEKNQRSRMNCVVEKRRAEEIVDHQPRTIRLPFGVNVTTDPRYEHVSGEKMAIYCESGKDQRSVETELTLHILFLYVTTF